MTLVPLMSASPRVIFHALTAISALLLGTAQVAFPKGTLPHRAMGWIWVVLMVLVAL